MKNGRITIGIQTEMTNKNKEKTTKEAKCMKKNEIKERNNTECV
jgi:3-deoxy-D-arabino-heptulosonate 7-phosphate (DAHP) synthase class II